MKVRWSLWSAPFLLAMTPGVHADQAPAGQVVRATPAPVAAAATVSPLLEKKVTFNIGAQPMVGALVKFSEQTGLQVAFATEDAKGLAAPAITGELTPAAALKRLLDGSGLRYEFVDEDRVITIRSGVEKRATGGVMVPAGQVRMAGDVQAAKPRATAEDHDSSQQIVVKAEREQVFKDRSVDLPRTEDDAQAYYLFDSKEIERSGAIDLEDFLRKRLTMDATSGTQGQSFFLGGTQSSLNLRGIGATQTLVLVNGRRSSGRNLAVNGGSARPQVDLNGIPLSAVERIEVLPTTSSAIYGGSAIGGVINVVLKRNYSGGDARVTYQNTMDKDTPIRRADLTYGFSFNDNRTQVMLSGGYSDMAGMMYQDRDFIREYDLRYYTLNGGAAGNSGILGATPNILPSSGTAPLVLKPAFGGGSIGSTTTFVPYGLAPTATPAQVGAALRANAGRQNTDPATGSYQIGGGMLADMGTPYDSDSFMTTLRHQLTPSLELNGEFAYNATHNKANMSISYLQSVAATSPINPFTTNVLLYVPRNGSHPRDSSGITRRATLGFIQKLPAGWTAQGDYTWSDDRNANSHTSSTISGLDVTDALNAGTLNPFVDTNLYPFDLSRFGGVGSWRGVATLNDVSVRAAGPLWRLPGGPITLAVGLQRRRESAKNADSIQEFPNFPNRNTITRALGQAQTTESLYLESVIPVISGVNKRRFIELLDFQLAGRVEDYSVTAGTASVAILPVPVTPPVILRTETQYKSSKPTIGLRYKPVPSTMFRMSYSGGFLPPNYSQLLQNPTPSTGTTNVPDPRRNNAQTPVRTLSGGNPNLKPEISQTWNAGIVFEPTFLQGLRISLDWYNIEKEDNIGSLTAAVMVANESLFPERIIRAAPLPGDTVGVIQIVDLSSMNLLKTRSEGFDMNVSYQVDTARFGSFTVSTLMSRADSYKRQTVFGQPFLEYVGITAQGPLRLRTSSSLTWERGSWVTGWSTSHYDKSTVSGPPITTSLLSIISNGGPFVPSQTYHDAFVSYRFDEENLMGGRAGRLLGGAEVQLGLNNVLDTQPPYDGGSGSYHYSTLGNLRMREYRISITKPF